MRPSILSRFKPEPYFFKVDPAWLYHSYDTPQAEKLDKVLIEKDGEIGIELLKRYGIHPSEKEAIPEIVQVLEATEKAYVNQLDAIAQKTGIGKDSIATILETDFDSTSAIENYIAQNLGKEKSESGTDPEALLKIKETLRSLKQERQEDKKLDAIALEIYIPELNQLRKAWTDAKGEYYLALEMVFLNCDRCVSKEECPHFTLEDIKALHPGFQTALFTDFVLPELTQWEKKVEEKEEVGAGEKK